MDAEGLNTENEGCKTRRGGKASKSAKGQWQEQEEEHRPPEPVQVRLTLHTVVRLGSRSGVSRLLVPIRTAAVLYRRWLLTVSLQLLRRCMQLLCKCPSASHPALVSACRLLLMGCVTQCYATDEDT